MTAGSDSDAKAGDWQEHAISHLDLKKLNMVFGSPPPLQMRLLLNQGFKEIQRIEK